MDSSLWAKWLARARAAREQYMARKERRERDRRLAALVKRATCESLQEAELDLLVDMVDRRFADTLGDNKKEWLESEREWFVEKLVWNRSLNNRQKRRLARLSSDIGRISKCHMQGKIDFRTGAWLARERNLDFMVLMGLVDNAHMVDGRVFVYVFRSVLKNQRRNISGSNNLIRPCFDWAWAWAVKNNNKQVIVELINWASEHVGSVGTVHQDSISKGLGDYICELPDGFLPDNYRLPIIFCRDVLVGDAMLRRHIGDHPSIDSRAKELVLDEMWRIKGRATEIMEGWYAAHTEDAVNAWEGLPVDMRPPVSKRDLSIILTARERSARETGIKMMAGNRVPGKNELGYSLG